MYKCIKAFALGCAVFSFNGLAVANDASVEFNSPSAHFGSPKVNLNLTTEMIVVAAMLSGKSDPELTQILNKLEKVKIRVYNTGGERDNALKSIDDKTKLLESSNWFKVINRDEEGKITRVFTRRKDELLSGVVVMTLENSANEGELAFVNIIGEIDPSEVSKVAATLNVGL